MSTSESAKKVIVVTDGDSTARKVVERVASNIGGPLHQYVRRESHRGLGRGDCGGHQESPGQPGPGHGGRRRQKGAGPGERALAKIAGDPGIEIIGAIAVASHTGHVEGVPVEASVDRNGKTVPGAVDKEGVPAATDKVQGDTVDILNSLAVPVIIGLGDLGKMDRADRVETGARVTTEAVQEIMRRAGLPLEDRG